jgi:hypothetical protein
MAFCSVTRAVTPALSVLVVIALACASCSEGPNQDQTENLAPTVWLSGAPPEGSEVVYRVHLSWGGEDPDGSIAYYEYAITNNENGVCDPADTTCTPDGNPWQRVYAADSVFVFTADILEDSLTTDLASRFERSHTFFIRAVDDRGLASPEPAYRSFTAWTLSPTAVIVLPRRPADVRNPALVPPIFTYHWSAQDYISSTYDVQDPDSTRWILHPVVGSDFEGGIQYVRDHPHSTEWSAWHDYRAEDKSGRQWTTPPTDYGGYVFAVQAKDEAGAVTPVFDENYNVRRVRVTATEQGPLLELSSEFTCPIVSTVPSMPVVTMDVPGGLAIVWRWRASADDYSGTITGYRYGWDIADLSDPAQWEIDFTPFVGEYAASPPRTFYSGDHTFDVEVIDNNGWRTRIEIEIDFIPFPMNKSVLFVDDFNPASPGIDASNGAVPSDAEHDAFWQQMLTEVSDFSWEDDAVEVARGTPLSLVKLMDYKAVIWDAWGGFNTADIARPLLYDVIHYTSPKECPPNPIEVRTNILSLFMKAGGHVMVCGYQPMTQVLPSKLTRYQYPFIFRYELDGDQDGNYSDQILAGHGVGEESFGYRDACVNVLDAAYTGILWLRTQQDNGCGVESIRTVDAQNDGTREALPIDPAFPTLELRPEVAGTGRVYAPSAKGWNSEIYNPHYFDFCDVAETRVRRLCFEPIYGNGCLNTASPIYGAPIATWSGTYRDIEPILGGGPAARSAFLGFEPYYFNPEQVQGMIDVILFDEWQLPHL